MQIIVNGDRREVEDTPTAGAFLAARDLRAERVVAELGGAIVPRGSYDEMPLAASDVPEFVQRVAGG